MFIFMGMEVIQSRVSKVETALTEDFLLKSHEDLVLCAAAIQSLSSKNGDLSPQTGSFVQTRQNRQQTAQQLHIKIHYNLLSRLASGFSISCEFFHFLQTLNIGSLEGQPH